MTNVVVHPDVKASIENFQLPSVIGFGTTIAPVMIECEYKEGRWGDLNLLPYGPISMHPTAKVLHYAQEIFEGLKAYKVDGKGPLLFRPDRNAKRFNHSAQRMAMPELPEELFLKAVETITAYCADFVPTNSGESLYIRPFVFATEESLGIKPSEKFKFMVVASPSGSYFTGEAISVMLERSATRATPGGTGTAKTGGNYARSLLSMLESKKLGYHQVLWLDSKEHKYIEEMSGMNFFAIIDGKLITPPLTDTILDGITRDSIITIANQIGQKVEERELSVDELLSEIKEGRCTEAFACGTAVIITPIKELGEPNGTKYPLASANGPIVKELRQVVLDIQEGRREGPNGWVIPIEPIK